MSGREILVSDCAGTPAICVINEAFAELVPLRQDVKSQFYLAGAQSQSLKRTNFLIRTTTGSASALLALRRAFQRIDPALPIALAHSLRSGWPF